MNAQRSVILALVLSFLTVAATADAQIAVSTNDNKLVNVNGRTTVVQNPAPDTATILDLSASPPRVIAEIDVPNSVVGPPSSVAITPDEGLALVTSAEKIDSADPTKRVPDNRLSIIDLKANPPRVIATLETGKAPSGVSINRQGTLALVANRSDGTVSVFTIQGKTVAPAGTVKVGDEKSGGAHVAIAPDGKTALLTRDRDNRISVLSIDGTKVEYTKRDMTAGVEPIALDIAPNGTFAVAANFGGRVTGDRDTVSLIDLRARPPRVVDTITVGLGPEGVKVSPDGSIVAIVVHNGSNLPKESPFYNDGGKLVLLRSTGTSLSKVAEKDYWIFEWSGGILRDTGHRIKMRGGPGAIRTADK